MFKAALFTIAKTWKPPKHPTTDEWIEKMWSIVTMEYPSAMKKNRIMPFAATCMHLEILILSETSQKEEDKYHMISIIWLYHMIQNLKYDTNEPIYKPETDSQT